MWHDASSICILKKRGSRVLRDVGILPHHYMASKPRRPWLEFHRGERRISHLPEFPPPAKVRGLHRWKPTSAYWRKERARMRMCIIISSPVVWNTGTSFGWLKQAENYLISQHPVQNLSSLQSYLLFWMGAKLEFTVNGWPQTEGLWEQVADIIWT
jgi:hypothetical protein